MSNRSMTLYLNVEKEGLEIHRFPAGTPFGKNKLGVATNMPELLGILRTEVASVFGPDSGPVGVSFMCSSSVDFPDEYTSNKDVINLCREINTGEGVPSDV